MSYRVREYRGVLDAKSNIVYVQLLFHSAQLLSTGTLVRHGIHETRYQTKTVLADEMRQIESVKVLSLSQNGEER